jgi:hypothetical protein
MRFLLIGQGIDTTLLFSAIVYSIIHWENIKKSMYAVRFGWLISFVLPLLPALFPLEMIVKASTIDAIDAATLSGFKLTLALSYALTLLPVTVTFPGGAVRASIRIRWLLPDSFLAGWILVMCAPFYSVVVCMALVIVIQIVGNGVLFAGMVLIVAAPCLYVVWSDLFTGNWRKVEKLTQVRTKQQIIALVTLAGYGLFLLWGFTADESGIKPIGEKTSEFDETVYLLSYSQAFRIILDLFGRMLVTTILFSDAILRVTLQNWSNELENGSTTNGDFQAFIDNFPLDSDTNSNPAVESTQQQNTDEGEKNDIESPRQGIKQVNEAKDPTENYDETEIAQEVESILRGNSDDIDKNCVAEILGSRK